MCCKICLIVLQYLMDLLYLGFQVSPCRACSWDFVLWVVQHWRMLSHRLMFLSYLDQCLSVACVFTISLMSAAGPFREHVYSLNPSQFPLHITLTVCSLILAHAALILHCIENQWNFLKSQLLRSCNSSVYFVLFHSNWHGALEIIPKPHSFTTSLY